MDRNSEVDSEAIFSMLDKVYSEYDSVHDRFIPRLQAITKKITGTFTTLSVNLKNPYELLVLKYNQPLSYHYSESLKTLFFTSRYIFLRKAFGRAVITEALPAKSAYVFNLFSNSSPRGTPLLQFPIHSGDEAETRS